MIGVLAQRLCKRLCAGCKTPYRPTIHEYDELVHAYGSSDWERLGVTRSDVVLYKEGSCEACNGGGYKGRVALHELLQGTEILKNLIQAQTRSTGLRDQAMKDGMVTLVQDGIQKTLQGVTTYRQIRAVASK
jgi:type II secretory ATPase GspE/PulE/Tfp pilus assembly ATPase PilB-like protein